jgi:hypothetical protein
MSLGTVHSQGQHWKNDERRTEIQHAQETYERGQPSGEMTLFSTFSVTSTVLAALSKIEAETLTTINPRSMKEKWHQKQKRRALYIWDLGPEVIRGSN